MKFSKVLFLLLIGVMKNVDIMMKLVKKLKIYLDSLLLNHPNLLD